MSRIKHDEKFYADELVYIATAWPKDRASFNGNQRAFNEYVEMQSTFAREDGFEGIARTMLGQRVVVPHSKR